MFSKLFFRSDALARQLSAPLFSERRQYLAHCATQGMSRRTLRAKARLLLQIAEHLRLAHNRNRILNRTEISKAAARWSRQVKPGRSQRSRECFVAEAVHWLTFLNRLQVTPKSVTATDEMLTEFRGFMAQDQGFSSATIEYRCKSVRPFLEQLLEKNGSLEMIRVADIDSILAAKVNVEHYARISIRAYASSLRSFFRFAELRGWCSPGMATSIMAPRVFQQETLPSGPTWEVVQAILDATAGNHPSLVRDHAMLMLFAVYGVRSGEVACLRLSDIDWQRDRIFFTRSKGAARHEFPLHPPIGTAIIRYLKEARPKSPCREIFLTVHAPIGPLSRGAIWYAVSRRLRERAPSLKHFGPHSLRHACATRLINEGLSLKEIGDHLGQRDPDATRIYAKVDLVRLREVASFDLGGLL